MFYVGKTEKQNPNERLKTHLYDMKNGRTKLYNAMRKYGPDNFDFEPIESVTGNRQRLNEREQYWIEVLDPEYNMTKGGDGGWINNQAGRHWKIKDTSNMKGPKVKTQKRMIAIERQRGRGNYQSTFIIHTPWGVFYTWRDAIKCGIIRDRATLQKYCSSDHIVSNGKRTPKEYKGKSTKLLGFYLETRNG